MNSDYCVYTKAVCSHFCRDRAADTAPALVSNRTLCKCHLFFTGLREIENFAVTAGILDSYRPTSEVGITQGVSGSASCSKQGQLWDPARLLTVLTSQVLETSKVRDCTASLGNPCPAWLSSGHKPPLNPLWTPLVSIYACWLSPSHQVSLWQAWVYFLGNAVCTRGCC